MASIIFVRRQSPDWEKLSQDFRRGETIDPSRYVPDHTIPGFPERVDRLIDKWNAKFKIDFFTFRAVLANLSSKSISSVMESRSFSYCDLPVVAEILAKNDAYCYFHDDDDFFAPYLAAVINEDETQADAIVTPLFRVGVPTFTFFREKTATSFIFGESRPHDFRYQTNNYGIHSRRCRSTADLAALKDHVLASKFADAEGFVDRCLPTPVSATIKTPGSASTLPQSVNCDDRSHRIFDAFIKEIPLELLTKQYMWLADPLRDIIRLVDNVYRGNDYVSIVDLL